MSLEEPEVGCANILVRFTEAMRKNAPKKGRGGGGSAKAKGTCKKQGW